MKLFLSQIFSRASHFKSFMKSKFSRPSPFKYKVFNFLKLNFPIAFIDLLLKTPIVNPIVTRESGKL